MCTSTRGVCTASSIGKGMMTPRYAHTHASCTGKYVITVLKRRRIASVRYNRLETSQNRISKILKKEHKRLKRFDRIVQTELADMNAFVERVSFGMFCS